MVGMLLGAGVGTLMRPVVGWSVSILMTMYAGPLSSLHIPQESSAIGTAVLACKERLVRLTLTGRAAALSLLPWLQQLGGLKGVWVTQGPDRAQHRASGPCCSSLLLTAAAAPAAAEGDCLHLAHTEDLPAASHSQHVHPALR